MTRRALFFVCRGWLLASLLALVACDGNGRTDTSIPTSTWLRSTDLGTEILLIASANPTGVVTSPQRFVRAFVAHDGSSTLDVGTYLLGADRAGAFVYDVHYVHDYDPTTPILDRMGSLRYDLNPPRAETLSIARDGATLLVTLDGTQHRYTNLVDLVRSIDASTATGATALFRVYSLPLVLAQTRVLGFDSGAYAQYVVNPTAFDGLVAGAFTVSVDGYPGSDAATAYDRFQDLTGLEVTGTQHMILPFAADGHMSGTLSWRFTDPATHTAVSGTCDYGALTITDAYVSGGYYGFTIDGHGTTQQDAALAVNIDLRDVLPVVTP